MSLVENGASGFAGLLSTNSRVLANSNSPDVIVGAALCGRPAFATLCFQAGAATEGRPYSYPVNIKFSRATIY